MILFSMIVYLGCYTDETHPNGLKATLLLHRNDYA